MVAVVRSVVLDPLAVSLTDITTSFVNLNINTTYFIQGKAANRMALETAFISFGSTVTHLLAPQVFGFSVFTTSVTVQLDNNGNPAGTSFEVSSGAFDITNTTSGLTAAGSPAATLTILNLNPNTTYQILTRSVDSASNPSITTLVTTTATLAAIPQPGSFPSVAVSSINIQWSLAGIDGTNSDNTEFLLQRSTEPAFFPLNQSTWFTALGSAPLNLTPNTSQYLRLKARNHNQLQTAFSVDFATTSLAATPGAPSVSDVEFTSITVTIEDPSISGNPAYSQSA